MSRQFFRLLQKSSYQTFDDPTKYKLKIQNAAFHTTPRRNGLEDFFEPQSNAGKSEIKSGRSWKKEELRIKSNNDLHKLWYILLKEFNMLKTMEHAHNEEYTVFPNPERIDKVEESMRNLESVVRERNNAYYMLEVGEPGEQPTKLRKNALGLLTNRSATQHEVPEYVNSWFKSNFFLRYDQEENKQFIPLYREKMTRKWYCRREKQSNYVAELMKRFKNLDMEAVKEKYPDVDLDYVKKVKDCSGHWEP